MKHTTEQLKLAHERGAEIECNDGVRDWMRVAEPSWVDGVKYRLMNPEKDHDLTRFDLYPFDLERALAGEELITPEYYEVRDFCKHDGYNTKNFPFSGTLSNGRQVQYNSDGRNHNWDCHTSKDDLFMKLPPKTAVKESLTTETEEMQPWQQIMALYKREVNHAEWQAKWEAGFDLQVRVYRNEKEHTPWMTVDNDCPPCLFDSEHEFREKATKKKYQVWCVDIYVAEHDVLTVMPFRTKEEVEELIGRTHHKVLSEIYVKEYEL